MTQEKIKQELEEILHDVWVAVYWGLTDTSTVEDDLSEAKSSAKKLIEKIDKYLESRKPKPEFKVGDIIVSQCFSDDSLWLVRLNKELINRFTSIDGLWYTKDDCTISDLFPAIFKEDTRHATPEEVSEYESALTFNENGRKPFELKKGDLLYDKNSENNFTYSGIAPNMTINKLKTGEYIFVQTREEVNELLENKQETEK